VLLAYDVASVSDVHFGQWDEESSDSSEELLRPAEREFLERADEELEKVNGFHAAQEKELLGRGEALIDQLRILADVKRVLADHAADHVASRRARGILGRSRIMPVTVPEPASPQLRRRSGLASPQSMSGRCIDHAYMHTHVSVLARSCGVDDSIDHLLQLTHVTVTQKSTSRSSFIFFKWATRFH
jgi:hypothetical protein